ncbi:hypothetical protein [Pseudomarimonas salicorniae]|uniref:DUF4932 domain-containing protein n=1 Tax=Pseudomarimonas salicorniae TaxID=2933270 RepID=A0ABT0GGR3_9GAMM|nr:hypothetical protein [Lysobacter sp. CAU 1642]MCK7593623.1 hypothetical protein [Lysobacter sp. CAU 1642]
MRWTDLFRAALLCLLCSQALAGPKPSFLLTADAWINLHHFLYHSARHALEPPARGNRLPPRSVDAAAELDDEEARIWRKALDVYARAARRDLLFDGRMRNFTQAVAAGEAGQAGASDEAGLFTALREAMLVYRRHWWPEHEQCARRRIEELEPKLARYGVQMRQRMESRYGAEWPRDGILVALTPYADERGAYTTSGGAVGNLIVFSCEDPRYVDMAGFEMLFHEAGHAEPFSTRIGRASQQAAERHGVAEGRLWHHYLFHATAAALRELVGDGYRSYADAQGLWRRPSTARLPAWFEAAWTRQPELDALFDHVHARRAAAAAEEGPPPGGP